MLLVTFLACHPAPEPEPEPPTVSVVTVTRAPLRERLVLPARLQPPADLDRQLAPQVSGRLVQVTVRAGDVVRAGQLLAEVETAGLDDARRAAVADLERARLEERSKRQAAELTARLVERGIASREERDADASAAAAATAARAEAEAHAAEAGRQRGRARLTAPFDGVVVALLRHPGETVDGTPSTPVLHLAGRARSEAVASATGAALALLRDGIDGTMRVGGAALAVRVTRVAQALDPATGLGEVAAVLTAPGPSAVPLFSSGELELVLAERTAVSVPPAAVRRGEDGEDEVLIVTNGAARAQPVQLGVRDGDRIEVLAGLHGGETIVADGGLGIEDGAAVKVMPSPDPAAAPAMPPPDPNAASAKTADPG